MEKPKATTAGPGPAVTKHIVMWNVRGETRAEKERAAQLIKTSFEELAGKIPGMRNVEVGLDMSGVDYACDLVLYMEFDTPGQLADYATHPEHLRIKQVLGDSRIARHQVDYVTAAGRESDHV